MRPVYADLHDDAHAWRRSTGADGAASVAPPSRESRRGGDPNRRYSGSGGRRPAEPIRISIPQVSQTASPAIADLNRTLSLNLPSSLLTFLTEHNIRSLAEINATGGIGRLPGLPANANDVAVRTLEAHASLSQFSPDLQVNAALIAQGFTSPAAIADAARSDFVSAARDRLGDVNAARMYIEARVHARVLDNIATERRAKKGQWVRHQRTGSDHISGFDAQFAANCGCEDCEAAISPLAYLADLINYAIAHLQNTGKAIDLQFLTDTFHQPFGDLPVSCEQMDNQVHQVRICIEVLRRYLGAKSSPAAKHSYRLQAYTALLNEIGTSYDEIRLARTADAATRQGLADRLKYPARRREARSSRCAVPRSRREPRCDSRSHPRTAVRIDRYHQVRPACFGAGPATRRLAPGLSGISLAAEDIRSINIHQASFRPTSVLR